jgi:hypothetical protein
MATKLNRRPFWTVNILAWSSLCTAGLVTHFFYYPTLVSGGELWAVNLGMGLLLTGALRLLLRKVAMWEFANGFKVFTVLCGAFAAAFIHNVVIQSLLIHLGWHNPSIPLELVDSFRLKIIWIIYCTWGIGYFGINAEWDLIRQKIISKKAMREARILELQGLHNRLDPHFLFNALNGIAAEIRPHPENAIEMVHEVSDYLRYSLDHRLPCLSSLSKELKVMEAYLKIEKARFGEKLHSAINAEDAARDALIPSFLLQALVENAVKHGERPSQRPLEVSLHCSGDSSSLVIKVTNTGSLLQNFKEGIGLSTFRRLLELYYPDRYSFFLENNHGAVCARLTLRGEPCSVS